MDDRRDRPAPSQTNDRPRPFVELRDLLVWGAGVSLLLINMGYLFDGTCKPLGEYPIPLAAPVGLAFSERVAQQHGQSVSDTTLYSSPRFLCRKITCSGSTTNGWTLNAVCRRTAAAFGALRLVSYCCYALAPSPSAFSRSAT